MMTGYLDREDATRETIKDGWLHSGDIAYATDDGHFFVVDRVKEMIKYKGHQVAPASVRSAEWRVEACGVCGWGGGRVAGRNAHAVCQRSHISIVQAELESVLLEHTAVRDCAVIPSIDAEGEEVPKAYVVLKEDATPEASCAVSF